MRSQDTTRYRDSAPSPFFSNEETENSCAGTMVPAVLLTTFRKKDYFTGILPDNILPRCLLLSLTAHDNDADCVYLSMLFVYSGSNMLPTIIANVIKVIDDQFLAKMMINF